MPAKGGKGTQSRSKGGSNGGGRTRSKAKGSSAPDHRRDLVALLLGTLALFTLVALVPVAWFGAGAVERFASGNLMGVVGGWVAAAAVRAVGVAAPALPFALGLAAVHTAGWISTATTWRIGGLGAGLLVLTPVASRLVDPAGAGAGWLGRWLGGPLITAVGPLGTTLVLAVAGVALFVVTLGWNPVRTLARGIAGAAAATGRGMGFVGERVSAARARAEERRALRAEAQAAAAAARIPDPEPDAEWTGPETGEVDDATGMDESFDEGAFAEEAGDDDLSDHGVRDDDTVDDGSADGQVDADVFVHDVPGTRASSGHDDAFPDPADPAALVGGRLPPLDLLTPEEHEDLAGMERELDALGQVLVEKLNTFKVQCELVGRTTGPVVTQFEVVPAPGVKVNRIANLEADLALAMRAQSIRIVAPIPGKGAVGVEIPNPRASMVQLRTILEAKEYDRARGVLPLGLGEDLTGRPYVADLAKMPHLLIAGATGSGKSVCINTIITSLVYRHTPETLRMLMIDPKMVELSAYADLPHLRHEVITDPADAAGVLKWAVLEMERRYQLLSANGVRSIHEFNTRVKDGRPLRRAKPDGSEGDPDRFIYDDGPLPWIVVVVDELADLMMQVQSEVEKPLAQLAQKARAIGIHLIVATQRPTVNVITGLIKANFPTRIAFRVASKQDSRTILDMNGAEALLGNGDMLFLPPGQSEPVRLQGAFLSTDDTDGVLDWFRAEAESRAQGGVDVPPSRPEADILEEVRAHEAAEAGAGGDMIAGDWDELFRAAAEVCIQNSGGSTSLLQRRLSIGYGRAARIVDQLHDAGVLGPPDGSKPREVLITLEELDRMFGSGG